MAECKHELSALTLGDRDATIRLFENYPFKAYQKQVQAMDSHRLAQLLWDLAEPSTRRPESGAWAVWRRRREAAGLVTMSPHAWHSEIFGRRMGRIDHFVNYTDPGAVGPMLLDAVFRKAEELDLRHLSCRVDGEDWPNVHLLEANGFRCVETSVKMARPLAHLPPLETGDGPRIRPYAPGDLGAIQEISARSHTHNHFYNDPSLDRDAAAAVFSEWIRRCAGGLAKFLLVAEDEEGRVVGFVTALSSSALRRVVGLSVGIIDYIVVDRDVAGRGVGRWLLNAALHGLAREHDWVELRTSHNNYRALAFYQAAEFRIVSTDYIFHCWNCR